MGAPLRPPAMVAPRRFQVGEAALPPSGIVPFSLFEADVVNRGFARLHLHAKRSRDLIGRGACLLLLTWIPLVALVLLSGTGSSGPPGQNFFLDFAAYLQFVVGLPLFVIAERVVAERTGDAAHLFASTGVVSREDAAGLDEIHRLIGRLRRSPVSDAVCLGLAYALSVATIYPELHAARPTWHTETLATGMRVFSAPGRWEMWVALPVLNYWWLRWIWKIALWCVYLYRLSRFHLTLVASHPDGTGGLGFLSDAQTNFGLVILAYGISNIASTIGYKILVEHASPGQMPVWGPLVGFVVGAPLLFTVPLFLFTKQLRRAKRHAIALYSVHTMAEALNFEEEWGSSAPGSLDETTRTRLATHNQLRTLYEHVHGMRVVPFDLRSFSELIGYATGPFLPLLTLTEKLDTPPVKWLITHLSGK
jgi:hypothetical protein